MSTVKIPTIRLPSDADAGGRSFGDEEWELLHEVGGGSPPTATAEAIDLSESSPSWRYVGSMEIERRQNNAPILADGKVQVTGGVWGPGFNNTGTPVFTAERWDPAMEQFTTAPTTLRRS